VQSSAIPGLSGSFLIGRQALEGKPRFLVARALLSARSCRAVAVCVSNGDMDAIEQEVQELRVWAGRIRRVGQDGVRDRLRLLRAAASMPRAFLNAARRALAQYGDEVARRHGVSGRAQFAAMVDCRWRWGFDPIAYYRSACTSTIAAVTPRATSRLQTSARR
jgi:hypothetical protein